jgi:hypothetical protein
LSRSAQQPVTGAYAAPQAIQDARVPATAPRIVVRELRNRAMLRQAVIMSEILGKPLALRDDF